MALFILFSLNKHKRVTQKLKESRGINLFYLVTNHGRKFSRQSLKKISDLIKATPQSSVHNTSNDWFNSKHLLHVRHYTLIVSWILKLLGITGAGEMEYKSVQVTHTGHGPGSLVKVPSNPEIHFIYKRRLTMVKELLSQLSKCTLISCAQMQTIAQQTRSWVLCE